MCCISSLLKLCEIFFLIFKYFESKLVTLWFISERVGLEVFIEDFFFKYHWNTSRTKASERLFCFSHFSSVGGQRVCRLRLINGWIIDCGDDFLVITHRFFLFVSVHSASRLSGDGGDGVLSAAVLCAVDPGGGSLPPSEPPHLPPHPQIHWQQHGAPL